MNNRRTLLLASCALGLLASHATAQSGVAVPGTYTKDTDNNWGNLPGPDSYTLTTSGEWEGGVGLAYPYYRDSGGNTWTFSSSAGASLGVYYPPDGGPNLYDDQSAAAWYQYQAYDPSSVTSGSTDPIDFGSGAEAYSRKLLSLSGARSLDFEISYNSGLTAADKYISNPINGGAPYWFLYTPGDIGHWTHNYEGQAQYIAGSTNVVSLLISHRRWKFSQIGTNWVSLDQSSLYDTLTTNSGDDYILTTKDQTSYIFAATNQYYLTQINNPHGQALYIARNPNISTQIYSVTEPVSGKQLLFTYGENGAPSSLVTTVSDSAGRAVHFAYDTNRMLTNVIGADGLPLSYAYDTNGQMLSSVDSKGEVLISNQYDTNNRVIQQTDGRGNSFLFAYTPLSDSNGFITNLTTAVTDRNSNVTTYVFDGNRNLISVTTPLQEMVTTSYNSSGLPTNITDPRGYATTISYDSAGNAIKVLDPLGHISTMVYDGRHNLTSFTDADGNSCSFGYDSNNNILTTVDSLGHQTVRTYDSNSLLLSLVKPNGGIFLNSYTGGLLSSHTDPAGNTTSFEYDAFGNVTSVTNAAHNVTEFHYGILRNLTEIDDALTSKTLISYDWRLRKSSVTDPSGATTSFAYDGDNNVIAVTNALNQVTSYSYDPENHLLSTTDPLGHVNGAGYDTDGRRTSIVNGAGDQSDLYYDASGNLISLIDGKGASYKIAYDACNHLTSSTDPLGRTSSALLDKAGRIISSIDPLSRVTAYVNDALGRTISTTSPSGALTRQSFDSDGNLISVVNGNNNSTVFAYDSSDRRVSLTTAIGLSSTCSYNALNLPALIRLPSGATTSIAYDLISRPISITDPVGANEFTYDACNRPLTDKETSTGFTNTLSRQYDLLGRLTNFTDASGNSIGYGYDAVGNLTSLTYPDGKRVTYGYDAANRLTSVLDWANRATGYSYDSNSRVTSISRPDHTTETMVYDPAGELTGSVIASSTNLLSSTFVYNAVSKITSDTILPAPPLFTPSPLSLAVDADNRLTSINGAKVAYDNNGNLLKAAIPGTPITSLSYDARNRLTNAGGVSYTYDSENHRTSMTLKGGTTSYVVNPNSVLSQILTKTTAAGAVTRYVYGLGLIGEDNGGAFTTYHYDARGSTVALTDSNGNVTERFAYGPHGEPIGFNPATAPTPFLYGGRYGVMTDPNGLEYMRARYYSPSIGRFVNQDVVLGSILNGATMNRYSYANGDPINGTDPLGLADQPLYNIDYSPGAPSDMPDQMSSQALNDIEIQSLIAQTEAADRAMALADADIHRYTQWSTGLTIVGQVAGFADSLLEVFAAPVLEAPAAFDAVNNIPSLAMAINNTLSLFVPGIEVRSDGTITGLAADALSQSNNPYLGELGNLGKVVNSTYETTSSTYGILGHSADVLKVASTNRYKGGSIAIGLGVTAVQNTGFPTWLGNQIYSMTHSGGK